MPAPQHPPNSPENRAKRAFKALSQVRGTLYNRMVDFVLANRPRLRTEASGAEQASFTLHSLEEQFLTKMNILDRALGELARPEPKEGQTTTTVYETVEVVAKRDELPQKIADALAERGQSDFLDLCVLRADENFAEVLLVLAREDHDVIAKPELALPELDSPEIASTGLASPGLASRGKQEQEAQALQAAAPKNPAASPADSSATNKAAANGASVPAGPGKSGGAGEQASSDSTDESL